MTITIVVTTLTAVLLLAAALLVHGFLGDNRSEGPADEPQPSGSTATTSSPSQQPPSGVGVQQTLTLDDANFCTWQLGTNPIPLVALSPVTMRIDARCNYPAEPDPGKDPGAAVFSRPSNNNPDLAIGRLGDGSAFVAECWVRGDRVTDNSKPINASWVWIRASSPDG